MAGTVTVTYPTVSDRVARPIQKISVAWIADGSGNANGTTIFVSGRIVRFVTIPSATAVPTASYDVTLEDENGIDVLEGGAANRSQSSAEQISVATLKALGLDNKLQPKVAAAGAGGAGTIEIYVAPS